MGVATDEVEVDGSGWRYGSRPRDGASLPGTLAQAIAQFEAVAEDLRGQNGIAAAFEGTDIAAVVSRPLTGHTIKPGILLGPEGHFETPDLPAACYMLWGRLPNHRLGVGAVIRLQPGERSELILDADHPSPETGIGALSVAEGTCQPIDAPVFR